MLATMKNVGTRFLLQTFGKEILAGSHKGGLNLARGKQTLDDEATQGTFNLYA